MIERTNDIWVQTIEAGGHEAATALVDLRDFILRGVRGYLRTRTDLTRLGINNLEQLAQDVVQEALIKIQAKLDTFRGKSKFTTWATKIAINHLISELRRRRWRDISLHTVIDEGTTLEQIIAVGPGHPSNPAVSAERDMIWQRVIWVLENELSDRQREAMVATQLNNIPMNEVAKMLNTNTNNIYKLIHDARLKLKKVLLTEGLSPEYILSLFAQEEPGVT